MRALVPTLLFVITVGFASDAFAFNQDWGGQENDWRVVADNRGVAGGMTSCTAHLYCTSCEESLDGRSFCVKAYRDAYCKCGYYTQGTTKYCISSGACLYRPGL